MGHSVPQIKKGGGHGTIFDDPLSGVVSLVCVMALRWRGTGISWPVLKGTAGGYHEV